jgi:hypothetical protein
MNKRTRLFILAAAVVALAIIGLYAIGAQTESQPESQATAESHELQAMAESSQTPATSQPVSMAKREPTLSQSETEAVKTFEARLKEYATLREKMVANAEPLPEEAKPEEIDEHRQALRAMISTARTGAKQGDFFTPGMVALIKRVCASTVSGGEGEILESAIMDENPGKLPNVTVNDRYPDGLPVSTMPIQMLEALPKLNEYLEYRFLGKRLVLVDASAGMVLDITPDVLP